jgi:hypothetical protein
MVTVKITVSWHVTLCSLVDMYHTFGGTCCLEHQGILKIETEDSSRILVDMLNGITSQMTVTFKVNVGSFGSLLN